jgi:hypothetical protein
VPDFCWLRGKYQHSGHDAVHGIRAPAPYALEKLGNNRMRESRTSGSLRAKAKWLSYSGVDNASGLPVLVIGEAGCCIALGPYRLAGRV